MKPGDPGLLPATHNLRAVAPEAAADAFTAYAGLSKIAMVNALVKAITDAHGEGFDEDGITIVCTPAELRATILAALV